jgi:hypothetical protein
MSSLPVAISPVLAEHATPERLSEAVLMDEAVGMGEKRPTSLVFINPPDSEWPCPSISDDRHSAN